MAPLVVQLLYGLAWALIGAAGISWLWWSRWVRKAIAPARAEARHAAEVLVRLQELAVRVAFDVDEHSSRVEEINQELTSEHGSETTIIVDIVAKLVQANQNMNQKLASTEVRLRQQASEIQTHAAEARTDALTMLANRRAFDDELARRVAEFRRQGRTFSLIMADVDHFKEFNDAHGHQAGDEALCGVAKLLRRKMREVRPCGPLRRRGVFHHPSSGPPRRRLQGGRAGPRGDRECLFPPRREGIAGHGEFWRGGSPGQHRCRLARRPHRQGGFTPPSKMAATASTIMTAAPLIRSSPRARRRLPHPAATRRRAGRTSPTRRGLSGFAGSDAKRRPENGTVPLG